MVFLRTRQKICGSKLEKPVNQHTTRNKNGTGTFDAKNRQYNTVNCNNKKHIIGKFSNKQQEKVMNHNKIIRKY